MAACDWPMMASLLQRFLQSESSTPKLMREPNAIEGLLRLNPDMGPVQRSKQNSSAIWSLLSPEDMALALLAVATQCFRGSSGWV